MSNEGQLLFKGFEAEEAQKKKEKNSEEVMEFLVIRSCSMDLSRTAL